MKSMHVFHFAPGNALRGAHAGLVRVAPGTTFPSHTHVGTETTLFLAGTARDDVSGTLHLPGDVVTLGPQSVHHATVLPPHECIFAVLFEGGTLDFHDHGPGNGNGGNNDNATGNDNK
jgi:quercetin dioxygenase-like cupin family protein